MNKVLILVIVTFFVSCNVSKTKQKGVIDISSDYLKEKVFYLASDALKGRKTGSPETRIAARYIENEFKSLGVKPYFSSRNGNDVFSTYYNGFEISSNKETVKGFNIVGLLEGTDKNLKKEYIILGAHYDHIGELTAVNGDSIANGANDNAAGTSAVLAMAKYFAEAKNNKRSILFVLFSGEEMGLKGSTHLSKTLKKDGLDLYTMINFEMIGIPMKDRGYNAYLSGYDLSNMADKINEITTTKTIGLLPKAKSFNLFKRSDNYPFYRDFKVPSQTISTFDFENYDYYHHVDDEAELMNYTFMASLLNEIKPAIVHFANTPTKEIKMYE